MVSAAHVTPQLFSHLEPMYRVPTLSLLRQRVFSNNGGLGDEMDEGSVNQFGDDYARGGPTNDPFINSNGPGRKRQRDGMAEHHEAPKKRAQVPAACYRCKSTRRKCSDFRPCKRCVDAGIGAQCLGVSGDQPEQQNAGLLSAGTVDYCAERFFARLSPTIPIITAEYIAGLKGKVGSPEDGSEAYCVLVAMCALVLLQVEEPDGWFSPGVVFESNATFGRSLFEEALAAHHRIPRRSTPSFEQVLLNFFIYACHAGLFHHSQAFVFIREATTQFLLLKPDRDSTQGQDEASRTNRLFWVLLISERSHAIRYRRPVTLQITADTPVPDSDPALIGFWSLAALFRPLDTSFIALLNQEKVASPPSISSLEYIETSISVALRSTFELQDTQKSNLRVTQLWLRIILWQLRLRFGHLSEHSHQSSLTYSYPLEVAKELTLSTRDLTISSMKVHGVGLTEKLYDIASAVVDVLARVPLSPSSPHGVGSGPAEDLVYLRRLISALPGGNSIYDALLDKHIQQALPNMDFGQFHANPV